MLKALRMDKELSMYVLIDVNFLSVFCFDLNAGRETKNGYVVCERRWSYPCTFSFPLSMTFIVGLLFCCI